MSVAICKFSSSRGQPATHWCQESEFHKRAFSATALPTLRQLRNIDRLEIDIRERLSVVVEDDETGVGFLDGPRRREAASFASRGCLFAFVKLSKF
jgi:hypothetical protein